MGTLHGTIIDEVSGESLDAKVHVLNATGSFSHPPNSMLKRGPGDAVFLLRWRVCCRGQSGAHGCTGRARHRVRAVSHDRRVACQGPR